MEEKIIAKSELKDPKKFCILLPTIALALMILFDLIATIMDYNNPAWDGSRDFSKALSYGFGGGNGMNTLFYVIIIVLVIATIVFYKLSSKIELTVTDKRVYGYGSFRKRVDLPLDSITAIGTTRIFSGLTVTTASGSIKFIMLKNRDELHKAISDLLIDRQGKEKPVSTIIKQETSQSNADELKKYKELLDSGAITQEEYDAKKKELLGL